MSAQALLVILLVGLVAGWLAGQIVQGTGFGLVADIAIGIVGALIGSWLLPELGIHLGSGIVAAIISAEKRHSSRIFNTHGCQQHSSRVLLLTLDGSAGSGLQIVRKRRRTIVMATNAAPGGLALRSSL